MITVSEDAGKTFKSVIPYSGIHPDHHAWWIHPTNSNLIIEGNDGGIGISKDRGASWRFDEQLPFGQFYHINVDNEIPYNVMGGLQDNGSWRGPAYTWVNGGIRNYYWESLWGGDGFDVVPDPEDSKWVYAMSQGGNVGRYNFTTGQRETIKPPAPDAKIKMRFNWNSGIALDPFDSKTVYFGSQFLHKSTDKGINFSNVFTAPSIITSIECHSSNPSIVYLTTRNLSGKVLKSTDGGLNFTDISTGLPNIGKNIIVHQGLNSLNPLYVGTTLGVFYKDDSMSTWVNFDDNLPNLGDSDVTIIGSQ